MREMPQLSHTHIKVEEVLPETTREIGQVDERLSPSGLLDPSLLPREGATERQTRGRDSI